MSNYFQLIPEKVYNELPEIELKIKDNIKGFSSDNLKELISIICCHIRKKDGAAPLRMEYLKKLVPQADKYLHALIKNDIVLRVGDYLPGVNSYKYKFTSTYVSKYLSLPVDNNRLEYRIRKVQKQFKEESQKQKKEISKQVGYIEKLTLADGYLDAIKDHCDTEEKYNSAIASATRIVNHDFFHKVDTTSGRFHSNATNCPSFIRGYFRINDQQLCNVDVKNCQPFLTTILLTDPGKASPFTKNPAFAVLLQSLKYTDSKDVKKYIEFVISGQLYEYLLNEFANEGLHLTRDEVKVQMLRILFARNRMPKDEINRKCRMIFKNRFPKVHRIFSKIRGSERGDPFTSFKRFAVLLQSIESFLMLDVILKRIYKELPGVVAITIHDSIMTGVMTNNVAAVKKIIEEEMFRFVGFLPQIKIENSFTKIIELSKERKERKGSNQLSKVI